MTLNPISTSSISSSIKCFKCLNKVHIAFHCLTKKTMIILDDSDVINESFSLESSSSNKSDNEIIPSNRNILMESCTNVATTRLVNKLNPNITVTIGFINYNDEGKM
ncbi:hypothetical protein CR513_62343, partial [Mucuna pruriens]